MAITKKEQEVKNNYLELVILYFKYKNVYNFGFQKYAVFRNMIRYVADNNDAIFCRSIFTELQNANLFEKKMNLKSINYRFNPYPDKQRPPEPKLYILDYT